MAAKRRLQSDPTTDPDVMRGYLKRLLKKRDETLIGKARIIEQVIEMNGWGRREEIDYTKMDPEKLEALALEWAPVFLELVPTRALRKELERREAIPAAAS